MSTRRSTQAGPADRIELRMATFMHRLKGLVERDGRSDRVISHEMGLARTYIYDILTGKNQKPSLPHLIALAEGFGITLASLVGERQSDPIPGEQGLFTMPVVGYIEMGTYKTPKRRKSLSLLHFQRNVDHPEAEHFAFEVRDNCFDRAKDGSIERGSTVACVNMLDAGLKVKNNGLYVIRRSIDGGKQYETILRRARVGRKQTVLTTESSAGNQKPYHPIIIDGVLTTDPNADIYAYGLVYGVLRFVPTPNGA